MSATTCPCVQSAIPVTKEWILQKIQCYQRALQDLTYQLNSFSTIARLPDELLCKIFTFYAADHGIKAASIRQAHYQPMQSNDILVYGFIRITHVCRYWRDVAMKFTPLWTRISVDIFGERGIRDDAWMAELLRRSGTAPLTVKFSVTSKRSKMVDNILKSEYHRIQDLSIHLIAPIPNASTVFQGVSLLDTLDIEISHFTRKLFPLNVHHLPLPSRSFPQLKTLKTKGMTLKEADYFLQPTLCSFTYLHRPDHYDQGHFNVDLSIAKLRQYLEALRKIPIVEYLCIDTNMLSTSTESQANRRVSLPSLKVLSITENIQTAVCLLNALDTVRLRVLDLTISSRDRPPNPDQIIPTAIQLGNSISTTFGRGNLDTERRGTLKYIRIALGYSGEIDLRASDNLQSLRKTASLDYSNLHVRMDSLGIDYMLELCKTVNFDAIQVIAVTTFGAQMIYHSAPASQQSQVWAWLGVLASITSRRLGTLVLSFASESYIAAILKMIMDHIQGFKINTLVLTKTDLSVVQRGGSIETQLKARVEAGVPIEKLIIATRGRHELVDWFGLYVTGRVIDIAETSR